MAFGIRNTWREKAAAAARRQEQLEQSAANQAAMASGATDLASIKEKLRAVISSMKGTTSLQEFFEMGQRFQATLNDVQTKVSQLSMKDPRSTSEDEALSLANEAYRLVAMSQKSGLKAASLPAVRREQAAAMTTTIQQAMAAMKIEEDPVKLSEAAGELEQKIFASADLLSAALNNTHRSPTEQTLLDTVKQARCYVDKVMKTAYGPAPKKPEVVIEDGDEILETGGEDEDDVPIDQVPPPASPGLPLAFKVVLLGFVGYLGYRALKR